MMTLIGTYIGIGLAGVLAIYIVAKIILQHTIRRAPDYYEKYELAQEAEMLKNVKVVEEVEEKEE